MTSKQARFRSPGFPACLRARGWLLAIPLALTACGAGSGDGAGPPVTSPTDDIELTYLFSAPSSLGAQAKDELGLFQSRLPSDAYFCVANRSDVTLGFWGDFGTEPVYRLAVRAPRDDSKSEVRWVEQEPLWIECGTAHEVGLLEPTQSCVLKVEIPAPGFAFRVGVGTWRHSPEDTVFGVDLARAAFEPEPARDGPNGVPRDPAHWDRIGWAPWNWVWSEPFELDQPGPSADRERCGHAHPDLLWKLNLTERGVGELSPAELWDIGVKALNWPSELPDDATQKSILRALLDAKYKDVGDYDGADLGY